MNDTKEDSHGQVPEDLKNAVLVHSSPMPAETPVVKGIIHLL